MFKLIVLNFCMLYLLVINNKLTDAVGTKQAVTCEGQIFSLRCSTGEIINIKQANYGRTDGTTCPHPQISNRNCKAPRSLDILKIACNGKIACDIRVINNVFGDPCYGTYKYLFTEYECIKTDEKKAIACEGATLNLECLKGEKLHIISANYGRTAGSVICPHRYIANQNCHASNSINIVKDKCNKLNKCSINAINYVFGDPCVGTYKYLEVQYKCKSEPIEATNEVIIKETKVDQKEVLVCEGNTLNIVCKNKEEINIISANYGRTAGPNICPHRHILTHNCKAISSLQILQNTCNKLNKCSINAVNNVFGDPCYGTYKYLAVKYECKAESIKSTESNNEIKVPDSTIDQKETLACEGNTLNIVCQNGEKIKIINANYGRTTGPTICPHPQILTHNCRATNSFNILQNKCNNLNKCSINAVNTVFGDPCVGTYKYLAVKYECIPEAIEPAKEDAACLFTVEKENTSDKCMDDKNITLIKTTSYSEGEIIDIKCKIGQIINIKKANYDPLNGISCLNNFKSNTKCSAQISIDNIQKTCNNKNQCSINATRNAFGNPCPGIYKNLSLEYECTTAAPCKDGEFQCRDGACLPENSFLDGKANCKFGEDEIRKDYETKYACEGQTMELSCKRDEILTILNANYGRLTSKICTHSMMHNQSCESVSSLDVIKNLCERKGNCIIPSNNAVFGDPCVGTYKYTEVHYQCIKVPTCTKHEFQCDHGYCINLSQQCNGHSDCENGEDEIGCDYLSEIACENSTLQIECKDNEIIEIIGANYGRQQDSICIYDSKVNCTNSVSKQKLIDVCNGKRFCTVEANNNIFGDPCIGTRKYLSVNFQCIQRNKNTKNSLDITKNLIVKEPPANEYISASPCKDEEFQCRDGTFLSKAHFGDGIKDCRYGEDEIGKKYESKYTCEGQTMNLSCKKDEALTIINANYGRLTSKICTHRLMQNQTCRASDSYNVVKNLCHKKEKCTIPSTNKVFGDPCVGTHKYVEVHYECVKNPTCKENEFKCNDGTCIDSSKQCDGKLDCENGEDELECDYLTEIACENSILQIECKCNETIQIIGANYGRQLLTICDYQTTINCTAPDSEQILKTACNGKRICTIEANNKVFGDPCIGTKKYLAVNYNCLERIKIDVRIA